MEWNYDWTKMLVINEDFDLFPIQFANTKRIETNDAVYIFDEVGCGKTISAGLMALHYLCNGNADKSVQIITINSLVRPKKGALEGQFLMEWYEKLPFESLGLKGNVRICNNDCRNIKKIADRQKKIGLLIIDEAHLFLEDTKRLEQLKRLRAEKVIFLTATPVKHYHLLDWVGHDDFIPYAEISKAVLNTEKYDMEWIAKLIVHQGKEDLICSSFDPVSPVTRYFKDTVMALEYSENGSIDFEKDKAKRLNPHIWEYDPAEDKEAFLADRIIEEGLVNKDGIPNRFVIFTRYINKEEKKITEEFERRPNEFRQWNEFSQRNESDENVLTYLPLNGKTRIRPSEFSDNGTGKKLPDILILTYQIAEQGLNLPGYNYVINYHISAYPSSLEQRFGRIDRMGKRNSTQYSEINMVYLLSKHGWDTYDCNFYFAVGIYRDSLLSVIPAKNVVLTREILQRYKENQEEVREYIQRLSAMVEDDNAMQAVVAYLEGEAEEQKDVFPNNELTEFCIENEITLEQGDTLDDIRTKVKDKLKTFSERFHGNQEYGDEWLNGEIENGDKIFCFKSEKDRDLILVDAIHDCAETIYCLNEYKEYEEEFNRIVKVPKIFEKWREPMETFFEEEFLRGNGCLENIFVTDYGKLMAQVILCRKDFEKATSFERECLCNYAREMVSGLPFFRMVSKYKDIIYDKLWVHDDGSGRGNIIREEGWYLRVKFDEQLPLVALETLQRRGLVPARIELELSASENELRFCTKETADGNYECSRWFKLFYHCFNDEIVMRFIEFIELFNHISEKYDMSWLELMEEYAEAEKVGYDGEEDGDVAESIKYSILSNSGTDYYESLEELIEERAQKDIEKLLDIINKIRKPIQEDCVSDWPLDFYYLFFGEGKIPGKNPESGEWNKLWRSPYQGYNGPRWSDLLPREQSGNGFVQIGWLPDNSRCDLWTYLVFQSIGDEAQGAGRLAELQWWREHFLMDRCTSRSESSEIIRDILISELVD